jgi:hypothetical protein
MVRYIDDFVLCFQYRADALRVQEALAKRLRKFGLTLEPTKTKLVEFGRYAHRHASKRGRKRPETIYFLGFTDAERFATYLAESLRARVFSENSPYEFTEVALAEIEFYPVLKHDLLFTNLNGVSAPRHRDPEKSSSFLRLNGPLHMLYFLPRDLNSTESVRFLHYISYSHEVVRGGTLEKQPTLFLTFAREACDWLSRNYVSLRGRNTADNLEEYLKVKRDRTPGRASDA